MGAACFVSSQYFGHCIGTQGFPVAEDLIGVFKTWCMDGHHGSAAGLKDKIDTETVSACPLIDIFRFSGGRHASAKTKGFQNCKAGFLMGLALGTCFIRCGDMQICPG